MQLSTTEQETRRHIHRVQQLMYRFVRILLNRCENHDHSKLEEPEKSGFTAMDAEPNHEYDSPEYHAKLARYKAVLDHHYKHNSHHPEHYAGFVAEMDLIDLLEMLCDWASRRKGLSVIDTITLVEQQAARFDFPPMLASIMLNTLRRHLVEEIESEEPAEAEIKKVATDVQAEKEQLFKELFDSSTIDISALNQLPRNEFSSY